MREYRMYEDLHLALNPSIKVIRRVFMAGAIFFSLLMIHVARMRFPGESEPSTFRMIWAIAFFAIILCELFWRGGWRGVRRALLDFLPSYLMLWWETGANGHRERHMALTRNVRTPQIEYNTVYYFRLSAKPRRCYVITSSRWNLPFVRETFLGHCYFARLGYRWWDTYLDRPFTFVWQRPDGTMAGQRYDFSEGDIAAVKKPA